MARALGLTQPRITQTEGLLMLSPAMQERVLVGTGEIGIRAAMRVAAEVEWERQWGRDKSPDPGDKTGVGSILD